MKQEQLIKELSRAAQEYGCRLIVRPSRNGIHLSTSCGSILLGPDRHQEIHPRHKGRYFKSLGIKSAPNATCG